MVYGVSDVQLLAQGLQEVHRTGYAFGLELQLPSLSPNAQSPDIAISCGDIL
jgi:hypothetical protein